MDVSVVLGSSDDDGDIEISVSDDVLFTPELASDLLRRAADTALRIHAELHPATNPKG